MAFLKTSTWLLLLTCFGGITFAKDLSKRTLTVCELFRDLRSYEDKIVTIRGRMMGLPSYAIGDPTCSKTFLAGGVLWPNLIVLDSTLGLPRNSVPFVTDTQSFSDLDEVLVANGRKATVLVTVTGQLRLKARYLTADTNYGRGGGGYGHLGAAPALLIVKKIVEITLHPGRE